MVSVYTKVISGMRFASVTAGHQITSQPCNCVCGRYFSVEHALRCNNGGFPIKRHNELRDITANLLDEICTGVGVEPTLQPLTQEQLRYMSANREDGLKMNE